VFDVFDVFDTHHIHRHQMVCDHGQQGFATPER